MLLNSCRNGHFRAPHHSSVALLSLCLLENGRLGTMHLTYADVFHPDGIKRSYTYDFFLVVCASILIALCAQVSIYLPISFVPVTGQTFGVLLVGALLGARRGALAVLMYLAEGAMGLPVFAGGAAGAAHLLGPTGGYLAGFVPAAYVAGYCAQRGWDEKLVHTAVAMSLATAIIFACGLAWLSLYTGSGNVLALGFYPFLPGAAVKIALATVVLPAGWEIIRKNRKK